MLQIKLLEDISGVSSALQGQAPKSNTPASLYAQQAANSAVNSKDAIDSFDWGKKQRDYKVLQLIQQFYNDDRHIRIGGRGMMAGVNTEYYDKNAVKDIKFDVELAEAMDTPVYRGLQDDMLYRLLEAQVIDVKLFLQNTTLPFAQNMLREIELREKAMQEGNVQPGEIPPSMMEAMREAKEGAGKEATPQGQDIINRLAGTLNG